MKRVEIILGGFTMMLSILYALFGFATTQQSDIQKYIQERFL